MSLGHAGAPNCACTCTSRVRRWNPTIVGVFSFVHACEHGSLHELHVDMMQWMGHATALQSDVCCLCLVSHDIPVPIASDLTVRDRDFVPSPHEGLHALHELHSFMTQSTGHGWVLHAVDCSRSWLSQLVPPCLPSTTRLHPES